MLLLVLRTLLIYVLIIFAMRLMGKKQLGELQPSELVSTILISNLASISIESPELPLVSSVVPVFLIVALEILISSLCAHSHTASRLVAGSPKIIIRNGQIDQKTLKGLRFSAEDLLEALRGKDIFELEQVEFAIVETNGSISVQKKFEYESPTNEMTKQAPPPARQPSLPLIADGTILNENLHFLGVDLPWVEEQCRMRGFSIRDILLFLCNDAGQILVIPRDGL